jgi:endothelin-converting enzyme/putative endopeptidase
MSMSVSSARHQAAGLCILVLASCALSPSAPAQAAAPATVYAPLPGFDKSAIDATADPCQDFYKYACGNYSKLHPIPSDLPSFDQFTNLYEFNTQALHGILEKVAAGSAERGSLEQKLGDYYSSCMDTGAIEKKGLSAIQPELDRIAAIKTKDDLSAEIAHLQRIEVGAFLDFGEQQDFKDATLQIAYIDQGGLGLPEKDYYLRTDAKSAELRKQYVQYLTNTLKLLGEPEAQAAKDAQAVMKLETELAKASMGVVDRREPEKIYHITPVAAFSSGVPVLQFDSFLQQVGAPPVTSINVVSPEFFKKLNGTIASTDLDTIKTYLRLKVVGSEATQLPKAFDDEHFDFYGRKLEGTPEQQVRWKRCVSATDQSLGELLGQLYVKQYFLPDQKEKTQQMVKDIEASMDKDLDTLEWMGPATRAKAKEKLHQVANKIGYPNKWRDYSKLEVVAGDAVGNSLRTRTFDADYQLAKIGKPVNRDEWGMSPPTVNAYYNPSMNDINFPAGILQPVFYDKSADDATNFGHIGSVVGHELTHGFDDEGRKFDGKGNLSEWWTPSDLKQFEQKTDCLVQEYGGFVAVDDLHVNGKLTLGENTADNGGARLAWMALMAHAAGMDMAAKVDGFTPAQQFFVGWAQNWCSTERPEMLRMEVQTDPHSPDRLRANGVVVNMPEFGEAFGCKKGAPMYPAKSCRVW